MKIITEIKDSIYNPNFYKLLPTGRVFSSSIVYLLKLSLIIALVATVVFSFEIPKFYRSFTDTIISFVDSYPGDLTLSVKNGVASSGKTEPYIIPMDKLQSAQQKEGGIRKDNILVIDTNQSFSSEQFKKYSTYAWITKTELVAVKNSRSEQIQVVPLENLGDWEINKSWIIEKEIKILKIIPWLVPIIIVFIYGAICSVVFLGTLISLFFYALVVWLMSQVKKVKLSYKDSYKIGIHAMTLVLIVELLSTHLRIPNNFFINLIIFMIVVYVNFFRVPNGTQEDEINTEKILPEETK